MDILLLQPPNRGPSVLTLPPLGLAYLAAALLKNGHSVQILDAPASRLNLAQVAGKVREERPAALGLGGLTPNFDLTIEAIKKLRPFVRHVIVGGPHASFFGAGLLDSVPEIDFLVIGEGEDTLPELLSALDRGRNRGLPPGAISREHPKLVPRPPMADLNRIPFPARALLPYRRYRHPASLSSPVTTLIASRGCPYPCIFCVKTIHGSQARFRGPENVADEIETIVKDFRLRELIFYDDNFLFPPARAQATLTEIIRRGLGISFRCEGRVDHVNPELLSLLKKAGCHTVTYGIETANPHGLKYLRKGFTVDQARKAVELTHQAGLRSGIYFILGIPTESPADMEKTIAFAIKLNPFFAQFSILSPLPGSALFPQIPGSRPLSSPRVKNPFDQDSARSFLPSGLWSESDLKRILKRAYLRFYLRPGFLRQALKNQTWSSLFLSLRSLKQILRWLLTNF